MTLPNIRWGLLYGVLLCNARAMGEFGAVAVVSGHVRGQTMTMPLQVEALFNDYDWVGAFTIAGLLSLLALLTLAVKAALEWRIGQSRRGASVSVELRDLSKSFGSVVALDRCQPDDRARRVPGAARTFGLRQDHIAARAWQGWTLSTPAPSSSMDDRCRACLRANDRVGFVFQHYALFRHMTRDAERRIWAGRSTAWPPPACARNSRARAVAAWT